MNDFYQTQNSPKGKRLSNYKFFLKPFEFLWKNALTISIFFMMFSYYILAVLFFLLYMSHTAKNESLNSWNKKTLKYLLINAVLLYLILEVETSTNYLVSYFDNNKYEYKPLEDNFYTILISFLPWWNAMIDFLSVVLPLPGVLNYAMTVLILLIAGFFKRFNLKVGDPLLWMGIYFKALTLMRLFRIISYSLVLVPNPKSNCYFNNFRVPDTKWEFFIDMISFRTAGCNDLIISGHTLFIWGSVLFLSEFLSVTMMRTIKVLTSIVLFNIIMVRNHYSVDVFLGILVAWFSYNYIRKREQKKIDSYTLECEEAKPTANDCSQMQIEIRTNQNQI
jgi:hypothetical protein